MPLSGGVSTLNGQSGALNLLVLPGGRLTLASGVPVMTSNQAGKTTIYYTPYVHNMVPIYDGTNMVPTAFSEISVATTDTTKNPAAIGASKVNDWFVWNDSGTLRLSHGPDWTNDTTRSAGTALVMVNGILLNNASITNGPAASRGTYVGTTRSDGSSQLNWILPGYAAGGTAGNLAVWNMYNRRMAGGTVGDSTSTWTYTSATIRPFDNSISNRISYVCGLVEDEQTILLFATVRIAAASGFADIGFGLNSTTARTGGVLEWFKSGDTPAATYAMATALTPSLGYNFLQMLESSDGTNANTMVGSANVNGMTLGWMM